MVRANKVFCLNLDAVKNKNIYQYNSLSRHGYYFYVFGYQNDKSTSRSDSYKYLRYPASIFKRIHFVANHIFQNRNNIHHVEIYTGGGSFLALEYFICRVFRLKICIVERGSPLKDIDSNYSLLGRGLRKFIFRNSDYVWIRELWMIEALYKIGRSNYFFLSNAIEISKSFNHESSKPISFVWCNSFKSWRNADWFVHAFSKETFVGHKAVMLGLLAGNKTVESVQERILTEKSDNLDILPFQEPSSFFISSKFFVLPADIVYLNFSMLEAMSFGVVPIVSDVDGAREIVEDGVDGFVINHSKDSLFNAMDKVSRLSPEKYEEMSRRTRQKVKDKFSIEAWSSSLSNFYREMDAGCIF